MLQKVKKNGSTPSSPEVVPHLALRKIEEKVNILGSECIQKYSHIEADPLQAI